jgi:hypothetical protein
MGLRIWIPPIYVRLHMVATGPVHTLHTIARVSAVPRGPMGLSPWDESLGV